MEGGSVWLMDTRKQLSESVVSEIVSTSYAVYDIAWVAGGQKLLTGARDSSVRLWDAVSGAALGSFRCHKGSVKSVNTNKEEPSMFVSSCRSGMICVWDTRCSAGASGHRPTNKINSSHVIQNSLLLSRKRKRSVADSATMSVSTTSVTAVLFHGDAKLASAGAGDGIVKLWDMRKIYTSSELPGAWMSFDAVSANGRMFGFTSLVADTHQSSLFATCKDNTIYQYRSAGLITKPVGAFDGSKVSSFFVKSSLSPDNKFLISGSTCGNAFIWEVDRPETPPFLLPMSPGVEVTTLAWCPSMDKILTSNKAGALSMWRVCGKTDSGLPRTSGIDHLGRQRTHQRNKHKM